MLQGIFITKGGDTVIVKNFNYNITFKFWSGCLQSHLWMSTISPKFLHTKPLHKNNKNKECNSVESQLVVSG